MKVEVKDGRLMIPLKLHEPKLSKSGKTLSVGSTRGGRRTNVKIQGKWVRVNANAYIQTRAKE